MVRSFVCGGGSLKTAEQYINDIETPIRCHMLKPSVQKDSTVIRVSGLRGKMSHANRYKIYFDFVKYCKKESKKDTLTDIKGTTKFYCTCKTGTRTIDPCSHIVACLWWLGLELGTIHKQMKKSIKMYKHKSSKELFNETISNDIIEYKQNKKQKKAEQKQETTEMDKLQEQFSQARIGEVKEKQLQVAKKKSIKIKKKVRKKKAKEEMEMEVKVESGDEKEFEKVKKGKNRKRTGLQAKLSEPKNKIIKWDFSNLQHMRQFVREDLKADIIETEPDGNCLFYCIALEYYGQLWRYKTVRSVAVNYIDKNRDIFERHFQLTQVNKTVDEYINMMKKDKCWGDGVVILAIQLAYDVIIHIHKYDFNMQRNMIAQDLSAWSETEIPIDNVPVIYLVMHEHGFQEVGNYFGHFEILRYKEPRILHDRPIKRKGNNVKQRILENIYKRQNMIK